MKTTMMEVDASLKNDEMIDMSKADKEALHLPIKKQRNRHNFGPLDLWKLQKKHKSLGSSVRW